MTKIPTSGISVADTDQVPFDKRNPIIICLLRSRHHATSVPEDEVLEGEVIRYELRVLPQ